MPNARAHRQRGKTSYLDGSLPRELWPRVSSAEVSREHHPSSVLLSTPAAPKDGKPAGNEGLSTSDCCIVVDDERLAAPF